MLLHQTETESFSNLDDAKQYIADHPMSIITTDSPSTIEFEMGSDGELEAKVAGAKLQFAERGFDRFCDLISVPKKFVKALPFENIKKDLYASLMSSALNRITFMLKNGVVVGATPKEDPVYPREVIDKAFSVNHKDIKEINLYDDQLIVNFTRDTQQPVINETIDTGISLFHNGGVGANPTLSFYFWRQICSNGAMTKHLVKLGRFSSRMKKDRMLNVFESRVNSSLDEGNDILCSSIRNMNEEIIEEPEKKYLKHFLSKKLRFKEHDDGPSKFQLDIMSKEASYYDLLNFITDFAKSFGLFDKYTIERLGGDMVAYFLDVKPTSELFKGYAEFKRKAMHKERSL